ncbi:OLC1v1021726C1 [Oldenlandia corymbosa var. corymbosa]|uniref:OLC1v1021726C1 n=1 Tax=Oldenlandia corymbosa var. corymbosa TaxID=529605 RepID=A0AAV1BYJ1_OLDCO|nr:OLC1v1021726C1 [Oldenlandia corymbosa var. corymbosa]
MANHEKMAKMTSGHDLPESLVEKIISHFPIDIATRAKLVSKKFINSWKLSRHLSFNEHKVYFNSSQVPFVGFVSNIMHQHSGSKIETFHLKMGQINDEITVSNWIRLAIAKGVENLELEFWGFPQHFPITSALIDNDTSIRVLRLQSCDLQFSPRLRGLKLLKTLNLVNMNLISSRIQIILNNCLALQDLEFLNCNFINHTLEIMAKDLKRFKSLKVVQISRDLDSMFIDAPTLQTLYYKGNVCSISISCVLTNLFAALFNFGPNKKLNRLHRVEYLVPALHYCKKLSICSKILEELTPKFNGCHYAERFPYWFPALWELNLYLGGSSLDHGRGTTFVNPYDIMAFLMKCPRINTLLIDLGQNAFEEGLFWKRMTMVPFFNSRPFFPFLTNLTVKGFKYRNLEFQLVRKIVESAPFVGKRVTLIRSKKNHNHTPESEKELLDWLKTQRCLYNLEVERVRRRGNTLVDF